MTNAPVLRATFPWSNDLTDDAFNTDISVGLKAVEDMLWRRIKDDQPLLNESSSHLLNAGGKRFRPMLTLLSAFCCGASSEQVIEGATVCELVHLATLYHDDVMDEAKLRRSVESANARWNNNVAIITGDFLFAIAGRMIADLGRTVLDIYHETSRRLVAGQIREMVGWSPGLSPEQHYMKLISDKTASLLSASARIGASLAGASDEHVDLLGRYGEELGLAFQLSDDVLDIVGGPALGKAVGGDLREGTPTLPAVYARQLPGPGGERLVELLDTDLSTDQALLDEAVALLSGHEAIRMCRAKVCGHVRNAVELLDGLPDNAARTALRYVAESMESRVS